MIRTGMTDLAITGGSEAPFSFGILKAWEDGQGSGVVTYNGRMVENLHVESAQRVLSMHEAIQALTSS